jgi:hypothetical protein
MGVIDGAVRNVSRTVGRAAAVTTAAAGAVGGATVDGIVGGVAGAVAGVQRGLKAGSRSVPAAALTFGAIGLTGLVEWPVLLAVGGGALLLTQLDTRRDTAPPAKRVPAKPAAPQRRTARSKRTPARQSRGTQSRSRR